MFAKDSSLFLSHANFTGNTASVHGGGVYLTGVMGAKDEDAGTGLQVQGQSLFQGNEATEGELRYTDTPAWVYVRDLD